MAIIALEQFQVLDLERIIVLGEYRLFCHHNVFQAPTSYGDFGPLSVQSIYIRPASHVIV